MNAAESRVFLSYAHGDKRHEADVHHLAELLKEGGVTPILDRDFDGPGMQWPAWMVEQATTADFVLVMASPRYGRRAGSDVAIEDIQGRGTWFEARLLCDQVYRDEGRESLRRILPVLLPGASVEDIPAFFAPYGGTYFRIRRLDHVGVANLLRVLRREPGANTAVAGFEPLRHSVGIDVRVAPDGIDAEVVVAGQVVGSRHRPMPADLLTVWSVLDLDPRVAAGELAAAGERLARSLFDPPWLEQIRQMVDTRSVGEPVEVAVTSNGAGLALPYELLRLPDNRMLSAVPGVSFVRRERGVDRPHPRASGGPLKILAAVAAPSNSRGAPLDVEAEMQAIIDAAGGLGRAQVTILEVASPAHITDALRRDPYHVVHLSAHGIRVNAGDRTTYAIELEDEDGNAIPVDAQGLVDVLQGGSRAVPLLVLSTCDSAAGGETGLAAALVRSGLHRVVAMQAPVTDRFATKLLNRVYVQLCDHNAAPSVALARARVDLYRADHQSSADLPPRPQHAIPTIWLGGADAALVDPTEKPVDLTEPTQAPAGGGVHELKLGELIGRRAQLRQALALLRGTPSAVAEHGATSGVVLTGIGGIGKTALAGRIMRRLREDATEPWAVALHIGRFNPPELFSAVAAAIRAPQIKQLLTEPGVPDEAKLAVVGQLLDQVRLLLVFDDFEQNLTDGGEAFRDPGFADVFTGFCSAAKRGKLLVTCRYPVPGADDLAGIPVPPLSRAELGRMLLRLPMLRHLAGEDRKTIIDTIGGHPRLIEFVDALMRGHAGRARMTEVAARLRDLARREHLALARTPDAAPGVAEAARQAVLFGSRDILLDQLLDLLTETQRETLLQAAMSRTALPLPDLCYAVDAAPATTPAPPVAADIDRLVDLTLLTRVDHGLLVQAWVREALTPHQGGAAGQRRDRAAAMHRRRVDEGRANFDDLTELARHLTALQRFDELADFALPICERIAGELAVATFLGDLLPTFPRDHPLTLALLDREREALANIGNSDAAADRANELLTIAHARADADPANVQLQRDLSISYNKLGDLAVAAGDPTTARTLFDQALTIARRLADADPANVQLQRDLAMTLGRLGQYEGASGSPATARRSFDEGRSIAARLAALDPSNEQYRHDLEAFDQSLAALEATSSRRDDADPAPTPDGSATS